MDKPIDNKEKKRRRRKRLLGITGWSLPAVALVAAAFYFSTGKSVSREAITIAEAHCGPLETTVAASGKVVPAFEEIVNSPVASSIVAVYVQPGDSVRQGMPLLELDLSTTETQYKNLQDAHMIKVNELRQLRLANKSALSDIEMQVKIKEMEVNTLEIEVRNEVRLDSIGSGTGERVRRARTAYETGHLQLQALRQRLVDERERLGAVEEAAVLGVGNSARDLDEVARLISRGKIPAPHDGIITFLNNRIGSTISAGEKVAVVGDLSSFKILAEVPEGSSFKIRPGAPAKIRLSNVELDGTVSNVEPQSVDGAVPFTITLADASNRRLRPGIRTQVYVSYGFKESSVLIPNGQYFNGPGNYMLYVADGDRLERREVKLGDSNREWVEVVEGIAPGEQVVVSDMQKYLSHKSLSIK